MVESIKELKKICQKKEKESLYIRYFIRSVSVYFTKILLHTSVTPNGVTVIGFLVGVIASIFFFSGGYMNFILGSVLLLLANIFDYVDGEIARYRKSASITGNYLDDVLTELVFIMAFSSLTIGLYMASQSIIIIILGFMLVGSASYHKVVFYTRYSILVNQFREIRKTKIDTSRTMDLQVKTNSLKKMKTKNYLFHNPFIAIMFVISSLLGLLGWVFIFYSIAFPVMLAMFIYYQTHCGGFESFIERTRFYIEQEKPARRSKR